MIQKIIVEISKWFIGVLFIFSGVVKLIDPLGTQYKLEEYFSTEVLNLPNLIPYSLGFALALILAEILLGISILIQFKTKRTLTLTLLLTLFFLFLTWYSAYYNKVNDCGCFGEVIKLTPWQTFYKNLIFLPLIILLISNQKLLKNNITKKHKRIIIASSSISLLLFSYYTIHNLPVADFSAYAVGKNIRKGMEYTNKYEIPPIHDFYLVSDSDDLTEPILNAPKAVLIIVNDLKKSSTINWNILSQFAKEAKQKGYLVYGISSSSSALVRYTNKIHQPNFEILFCDSTTVKTMLRNNAGVIVLNTATIIDKQSYNTIQKIKLTH